MMMSQALALDPNDGLAPVNDRILLVSCREIGALLEGRIALAKEVGFGDTDLGQRRPKRGPGALTHADYRRVRGFDEGDGKPIGHAPLMFGGNHAGR